MSAYYRRIAERRLAITFLALALLFSLSASQVMAQDDANTFSQELKEKTITFVTVNPYTQAQGSMTITFSGVFHANRQAETTGLAITRITGVQTGTFTFVPDDSSQPTISGKYRFRFVGKPQPNTDTLNFAFRLNGTAGDGSIFSFVQNERVLVSEEGFEVSFGSTDSVAH